jgi:hypothetical protein
LTELNFPNKQQEGKLQLPLFAAFLNTVLKTFYVPYALFYIFFNPFYTFHHHKGLLKSAIVA